MEKDKIVRYVVNSTNCNPFYSFFGPIVCLLWQKRMGYEPIMLLFGTEENWTSNERIRYTLAHIKSFARVHYISGVKGYKTSTVTQTSRLLAPALSYIRDQDYILTSDIDMFPLNKKYFNSQDWNKDFHIFSADAYADITKGHKPPKYPICYLGGRANIWRDIMGIRTNDIQREISEAMKGRIDCWDNDEMYFFSRISKHPIFKSKRIQFMVRTWPSSRAARRLDRDAWHFKGTRDLIDCHSLRPGYKHIPKLDKLFRLYFPEDAAWILNYMNMMRRLING